MKKVLKIFFLISVFLVIVVGCGIKDASSVVDKLEKKIENCNSYYLEGTMEIVNNEDTYSYKVVVSYLKDDYYKIDLVNTLNNHEQVILKNDDGVYVVTPSLNKSFKFQSDWPYNNSQIYLLGSIIEDLNYDDDLEFKTVDDGYYFKSKVNYPNNKSLVMQNVYVDSKMKIYKVEVVDSDGNVQIVMNFDKIEYDKKFSDDYFELSKLISIDKKDKTDSGDKDSKKDNVDNEDDSGSSTLDNDTVTDNDNDKVLENNTSSGDKVDDSATKDTATIDDVIYPMYLPSNTTLANKEIIDTDEGQRLILTFAGDNPFVLIEETISYQDEGLVIPVSGSMDFLTDVIGVINDGSVSFESNGISYYIASNKLDNSELVNIARSISVLPVSK